MVLNDTDDILINWKEGLQSGEINPFLVFLGTVSHGELPNAKLFFESGLKELNYVGRERRSRKKEGKIC